MALRSVRKSVKSFSKVLNIFKIWKRRWTQISKPQRVILTVSPHFWYFKCGILKFWILNVDTEKNFSYPHFRRKKDKFSEIRFQIRSKMAVGSWKIGFFIHFYSSRGPSCSFINLVWDEWIIYGWNILIIELWTKSFEFESTLIDIVLDVRRFQKSRFSS